VKKPLVRSLDLGMSMCAALAGMGDVAHMELMGMVDTSGLRPGRRPHDRAGADRRARRRLAVLRHAEEITGNMALTCRYHGISRQVFDKWPQRYDQHGLDGLRDRSHTPPGQPNATRTKAVGKLISLPQHDHFGPAKIAMYLRRYHDIQISHSGVWRVRKRLARNRLPATSALTDAGSAMRSRCPATGSSSTSSSSRPWLAHAQARPVHRHRRLHRLRGLCIYPSSTSRPPSSSPTRCRSGWRSGSRSSRATFAQFPSLVHDHVLDKGIGHDCIKPRTPGGNGKVERSHRIDAEELTSCWMGW
jgi:transposase